MNELLAREAKLEARCPVVAELAAESEHEITALDQSVELVDPAADGVVRQHQGVVLGKDAPCRGRRDHRRRETLGELPEQIRCRGRTLACIDENPGCAGELASESGDELRIGGRLTLTGRGLSGRGHAGEGRR